MNGITLKNKGTGKMEILSAFGRFLRERPLFKGVASAAMPALALMGLPDIVLSIPLRDVTTGNIRHVDPH